MYFLFCIPDWLGSREDQDLRTLIQDFLDDYRTFLFVFSKKRGYHEDETLSTEKSVIHNSQKIPSL